MPVNVSSGAQLEFLVAVSNLTFLSLAEKKLVLGKIENSETLSKMSADDIGKIVSRNIKAKFDGKNNLLLARRAVSVINSLGIAVLQHDEPSFPAMLREIQDAPFLLFCRGDISCLRQKSVSVVGTREITPQGKVCARNFARDAARDGYAVISGLAYGVDGEAHNGALDAYYDALEISDAAANAVGKTCAVLPGGVDEIVPHGHRRLAQKIVAGGGLLISECPPCVPVEKWRFVSRNRIIAALSPVTVVVEAPPASGALITAEFAAGYGRDVAVMETAFSCDAEKIAQQKIKKLEKTSKKHITTVNQFVQDGAAVIKDFGDYKRWLGEKPGERQMQLFSPT